MSRKKFPKSVNFTLGHSQVLLEINSVARGGLSTIFDIEEKILQIRKFHFGALTGAPGN